MSDESYPLGGTYHDPSENEEPSVDDARNIFLWTIEQREKARECLINLRDNVLPIYHQHGPAKYIQPSQLLWHGELEATIMRWALEFHLCAGEKGTWVIEVALHTLEDWRNPVIAKHLLFSRTSGAGGWIKYEPPKFEFRPWLIYYERRSHYRTQVLAQLGTYLDEAEKDAGDAGLAREGTTKLKEHFEWLVRRQVEGEYVGSITNTVPTRERSGVERAIRRLRKLLELPGPTV